MQKLKAVIVIGASAGGLRAIAELVSKISSNLNTAIFVVLHVGRNSLSPVMVNYIQKGTSFTCLMAEDELEIKKGHLYVAPPDYHLLLKQGTMRVIKGAHENRWRPSIDVLFRSAAASYESKVIGIILTGLLDDGTSGMSAIKRSGGICMVQEPADAEFEDMPVNVLNNVDVDYRVPIADMGYVLDDIFSKPHYTDIKAVPEDVQIEAAITERMSSNVEEMEKIGTRSIFSCPDCGGGLWEIKNDSVHRYRCYTGHVYTEKVLLEKQADALEESLWVAIRMLEERKNMFLMMAHRNQETTRIELEAENRKKAKSMVLHINRLKKLMITLDKSGPETSGFA